MSEPVQADEGDALYRNLGFLLHDAARLLRKRFEQNARAAGLGLTRAQWVVLAYLARAEGLKQCQLAETLDVEPITLARQIDNLERLELVERRADPADRRVRLLYLCAGARPLLEKMWVIGAGTRAEATAGFSDAERNRLVEMLLMLKNNLSERTASDDEQGVDHYEPDTSAGLGGR